MRSCLALSHVAFEDLGILAPILDERGYSVRTLDAPTARFDLLDPLADDLWVVLGGPIGVYDEALYPFLEPELNAVRTRIKAGAPILGLCLGAQMMARAIGGTVSPNPAGKEIGWSELNLSQEGYTGPLAHLDGIEVLHWHGDMIELPTGYASLASTPKTRVQAFSAGKHALGLQFHPEVDAPGLERWLVGHAAELSTAGVNIPVIRAANHRLAPILKTCATQLFHEWLP